MATLDALDISCQLKELQQEKKKLQNKLDHLQIRRKDLESKQDIVAKKNNLLLQKNENMSRTVHVAKMKMQETQNNVDKLQKVNEDVQKFVLQLKKKIQCLEDQKEHELEKFQATYDELANNFREARQYYLECSLEEEIANWKTTCESKTTAIANQKKILNDISEQLEELRLLSKEQVLEEKPPKSLYEIFLDQNEIVSAIFKTEAEIMKNVLEEKYRVLNELEKSSNDLISNIEENKAGLDELISLEEIRPTHSIEKV